MPPQVTKPPRHWAPPHTGHISPILTKHRSESVILKISKPTSHELIHNDEELEEGRAGGQNSLNTCHTDHLSNTRLQQQDLTRQVHKGIKGRGTREGYACALA